MRNANGPFDLNFVFKVSLALGACLLFVSAPALAAKRYKAFVRVDGATCYSCSYGIEKTFKKKHFGSTYKLDLEKGLFEIAFSQTDTIPTPEQFRDIIHDAGYSFGGVTVILDGQVLPADVRGRFHVQVSGSRQLVSVNAPLSLSINRISKEVQFQLHADMRKLDWQLVTARPLGKNKP